MKAWLLNLPSLCQGWAVPAAALFLSVCVAAEAGTTAAPSLAQSAKVTVDSCFPGYGPTVLTNGCWYSRGEEDPNDFGPTRLGNGGNAWVSGDTLDEHWICLEWPEPVTLDEVEICWALADWYPRAFRIERWQDGR